MSDGGAAGCGGCCASSRSSTALSTGLRFRRSVRSGWMMVKSGSSLGTQRFLSSPRPSCLLGGEGGGQVCGRGVRDCAAGEQLPWHGSRVAATASSSACPVSKAANKLFSHHTPLCSPAVAAAPHIELAVLADGCVVPVTHRHAHHLFALQQAQGGTGQEPSDEAGKQTLLRRPCAERNTAQHTPLQQARRPARQTYTPSPQPPFPSLSPAAAHPH